MREQVESFQGRKIKLILKNGFSYTGFTERFFDDCFQLRDKFGLKIVIAYTDLSAIVEVEA